MVQNKIYKTFNHLDKHFLISIISGKFLMRNSLNLENVNYFLDASSESIIYLENFNFFD